MSAEICLVLRLEGPLQAWGGQSRFDYRLTDSLPSKSAVIGMCCAAMGLQRGSAEEAEALTAFRDCRMTALALPRKGARAKAPLVDFHTVEGAPQADTGRPKKDCVLTRRHYLQDSAFAALLSGPVELLKKTAAAVKNPVWGLWLGRKCCIPSSPVFAGLFPDREQALRFLLPNASLDDVVYEEEMTSFAEGNDSRPDEPLCFASADRLFSLRRVNRRYPGQV